jgi:hypothetical protein
MDGLAGLLHVLAGVLVLAGAWAGVRGVKLFVRGARRADDDMASLWVVRGIRGIVVAVAAGALAGGIVFSQTWLIVFGAIFLAEELYETGVLALILRAGRRYSSSAIDASGTGTSCPPRSADT